MKRAIGIVRVSDTDGRSGDSFASPKEQADRIRNMDGLEVIHVYEELDVSGGKPLAKRDGLRQAVERIENGEAELLVAAYFDRLFRSLKVQAEVVARVENAGGKVIALDVGHVTEGSAAQWLSGTMLGAVSEYYRRSIGERIHASDARAVERGVAPFPRIPLGYTRNPAGILEPNQHAPLAVDAFTMRANGDSWQTIRQHLANHGHNITVGGLRAMLASRIYLGELRFGKLHNPAAHEPIIDPELFARVQATTSRRGPQPKSDLLLSRLRVLECGHCHGPMGPATWKRNGQPMKRYRCIASGKGHASIDIESVDPHVTAAAWEAVDDMEGRATSDSQYADAKARADRSQSELDKALRAFTAAGLESEPVAIEKLADLRVARDRDAAHAASCKPTDGIPVYLAETEREHASREHLRELISLTIDRVVVAPSTVRGERIMIYPRWGNATVPKVLGDPVK